MPRISKTDVNKALELAGKKIIDAGGADKKVSRADVAKALGSLNGTEKKLVDVFFKFVDHRDFKKGAQVTASDVQRAIAYAKDHMVAKYDLNANGLSKPEIAKMSLTGKLAVELAKALKAAAVDPAPSRGGVVVEGKSFYELRQEISVTSETRFTTATGIDSTLQKQIIEACHQSTYTDVRTLADAFNTVDQGEFVVRNFTDPANGKKYTAIDYGAGDSTYGAIFEAGKTTVALSIHDGDLMKP
jgi:hypothetical protein